MVYNVKYFHYTKFQSGIEACQKVRKMKGLHEEIVSNANAKLKKLKAKLDAYFDTYTTKREPDLYFYSSSLYYEIYVKFINSQNFMDRVNKFKLRIFEITIYDNLIRITFFVPYKIDDDNIYLIR